MRKSIIILIGLILFNFNTIMAQTQKNEYCNGIERKRLTIKEFKENLTKFKGTLNDSLTKRHFINIYVLNDGRAIEFFDTHAYLYESVSDLEDWIACVLNKNRKAFAAHILKDKLLFGEKFIYNIPQLIDFVTDSFQLSKNKLVLKNVQIIDEAINRNWRNMKMEPHLFTALIAYTGEVIKNEMGGGEWKLIQSKIDETVWEPYIIFNGKVYNPFFPVYRELYEDGPETGRLSIFERLSIELHKQ